MEANPSQVYWSESGELVTLACEDTFYVLRFSREEYQAALQAGEADEDGVEAAFEVVTDVNERYVIPDRIFQLRFANREQCPNWSMGW